MGRSTHPWLSRARPGSAEPGSGSPGRIGFGPTDPIPIPGFLNLALSSSSSELAFSKLSSPSIYCRVCSFTSLHGNVFPALQPLNLPFNTLALVQQDKRRLILARRRRQDLHLLKRSTSDDDSFAAVADDYSCQQILQTMFFDGG
ncbi:hypothetical protein Taro_026779 [Colocasia esculenta]|uniref:Uncharacterized protein n=1 Tax=Colocasia esculenta TaxID=4460 RepID=A0A843VCT4_COLES|nr:hypothetical protein [Colocasia esculenta]